MTKRVLHGLTIGKIAAVDVPCQEGAEAVILKRNENPWTIIGAASVSPEAAAYLKREFSSDKRKELAASGAAMSDGSYPIENASDLANAIQAIGRAPDPAKTKAHIKARAKALDLSDKIPDDWNATKRIAKAMADVLKGSGLLDPDGDEGAISFTEALDENETTQQFWDGFYRGTSALQASLQAIVKDPEVTDRGEEIRQSLSEFADFIGTILPGPIGKCLAAGVAAKIAGATGNGKGATMSDAVKKALGLAATATDAEVLKALEARDAELAKAKSDAQVAALREKDKTYCAKGAQLLPEGGITKFASMSEADRDAYMKAKPVPSEDEEMEKALAHGEAFKTPEGIVVMKSKVGDTQFAIFKALNDKAIRQDAELAKRDEADAQATFAKRATDLGFEADFGATMRKAYKGDAAAQVEVEKRMAALKKQADTGGVFKEFGGRGTPGAGSAEAELLAKRDELKKDNPKLTNEQAYARAYKANPDIVKRYRAEQAGQA